MRPNHEVSLDDAYSAGYLQGSLAAARAYRLAVHNHHATPAVAMTQARQALFSLLEPWIDDLDDALLPDVPAAQGNGMTSVSAPAHRRGYLDGWLASMDAMAVLVETQEASLARA